MHFLVYFAAYLVYSPHTMSKLNGMTRVLQTSKGVHDRRSVYVVPISK